jgi:hypothetical protein
MASSNLKKMVDEKDIISKQLVNLRPANEKQSAELA